MLKNINIEILRPFYRAINYHNDYIGRTMLISYNAYLIVTHFSINWLTYLLCFGECTQQGFEILSLFTNTYMVFLGFMCFLGSIFREHRGVVQIMMVLSFSLYALLFGFTREASDLLITGLAASNYLRFAMKKQTNN